MLPTLQLVREQKISELVRVEPAVKRWEASGVLYKDSRFLVVFDDHTQIACIAEDLRLNDANRLVGTTHAKCGYEGIT